MATTRSSGAQAPSATDSDVSRHQATLQRRMSVLETIINEYVRTAQPVASAMVAHRSRLDVSSATIRNDMSSLEHAGLIVQPHASSGRVPSAHGYRRFVDELMGPAWLSRRQQRTITHQFHQVEERVSEWVPLALAVLTRLVPSVAVASPPARRVPLVSDLHVLQASVGHAQVVVLLQAGVVLRLTVALESEPNTAWLRRAGRLLTAKLGGRDAAAATRIAQDMPGDLGTIARAVARGLTESERDVIAAQRFSGVAELLGQPEFSDARRLQQLVADLESGVLVRQLGRSFNPEAGVRVIIGDDKARGAMADFSAVMAPYGTPERGQGMIGVIGPQRMAYRRAVASVRAVARALDGLVTGLAA